MCDIDWLIVLKYFNSAIEVLKIFISWPVAFLVIVAMLVFNFKNPISKWIERAHVKGSWGDKTIEVNPGQISPNGVDPLAKTASEEALPTTTTTFNEVPPELRNEPNIISIIDLAKRDPIQVIKDYFLVHYAYRHERIFNQIYGSQIALLAFLHIKNDWGYPTEISIFYQKYIEKGGDEKYSFEAYINFLKDILVIELETDNNKNTRVKLTDLGRKFLEYVFKNYSNNWQQKIF